MREEACLIYKLLAEDLSVSEAMRRLIEAWAEEDPGTDYSPFTKLPYDEEVERLAVEWFEPLLRRSPPAAHSIGALCFCLSEREGEGDDYYDKEGDFSIFGSNDFELDNQRDWAPHPSYSPDGNVAGAKVISQFYRLMLDSDELYGADFEYSMCQGYVTFALRRLLRDVDPKLIVSENRPVQVIVGYDRGDAIYPGRVTTSGFLPRDPAEAEALWERSNEEAEQGFQQAIEDYIRRQ